MLLTWESSQKKRSAETVDLFLVIRISVHGKANTDWNIFGSHLLVINIFHYNDRFIYLVKLFSQLAKSFWDGHKISRHIITHYWFENWLGYEKWRANYIDFAVTSSQRPRKGSSLYWNECCGVHIKWSIGISLSQPAMYCSFLYPGIRQPHLGGANSTHHLSNTHKYQFLLLKDNDLTSTHLIFKIHLTARTIFHVYLGKLWQRPFLSFLIYCSWKSNFPPMKISFSNDRRKVIKYVHFIANLSHCQPSK